MNEFDLLICIIVIAVIALIFFREKEQKILGISLNKPSNPNGVLLDNSLKQKKGQELTSEQRSIIETNIGLYHWLPKHLIAPWEERIICFLEEFPITFMKKEMPTEEMRILVAAEACLLIVNRPLSDYRHLKAIHLWEDEIKGNKNARGNATRFEINLSWKYLKQSIKKARDGHNLTLHEFAHLIDFADDGIAQSIPVSRNSKDFKQWQELVNDEHKKLMKAYEGGKNYSIRAYGGYESIKGDKPELFSCGTSAFFERGSRLKRECPKVYLAMKEFYGIDPADWRQAKAK
ncbi:MAG: zinc-dependent peptidase [Opitutales bacterium]|nr:zinc-dependent peptidase [Opitutales bacterium]